MLAKKELTDKLQKKDSPCIDIDPDDIISINSQEMSSSFSEEADISINSEKVFEMMYHNNDGAKCVEESMITSDSGE